MIDGYRLEEMLGEGASGVVYAARTSDGDRVAVKVLRHERALDAVALARFRREAQLARGLASDHVVPILELCETENAIYLVMPYYARGSLAMRLRESGPLDVGETVTLATQIARGLDELHGRGIIHRDVKPSNVLLDEDGTAALADFGLARAADSTRLTEDGQVLGTVHYLAPELIEGRGATCESDVYALGCVLYECIAGEPPFADAVRPAEIGFAHLTIPSPDVCERRANVPEDVSLALRSALAKDPRARPTTATALARMLHVAHTTARA